MNTNSIFKKSKSNFALAFLGLPRNQRRAMEAVYAYCRIVDDIVDESESIQKAQADLSHWKSAFANWPNFSSVLPIDVARELEWAVQRFPIEKSDILWILEGVEKDLRPTQYRTLEELLVYCDGVASAVGLCCMSIFGVERKDAEKYAFATGRALQLTNILRDIKSDADRGRVYIPQIYFTGAGINPRDIANPTYNEDFMNMAHAFAETVDSFYRLAEAEAKKLPLKQIWPAEVMRKTYFRIFQKIREKNYDIFTQKVGIHKLQKVWIALSQPRA
ncbi:MAG: phytoene/squalene synthase family protein [Proteobacteria bacterium]|jgi:phytoene synthase|nr:phytoene/squalene synthase family protein [Pseudomonadota bacterium]